MPFFVPESRLSDYVAMVASLKAKLSETEAATARRIAEVEARASDIDRRQTETQAILLEQAAGRQAASAALAEVQQERDRLIAELQEERARSEAARRDWISSLQFAEAAVSDVRQERDRVIAELQGERARAEAAQSDWNAALRFAETAASDGRQERDRLILDLQEERARAELMRSDGAAAVHAAEQAASEVRQERDRLAGDVSALHQDIQALRAGRAVLQESAASAAEALDHIRSSSVPRPVLRDAEKSGAEDDRAFFIATTPGRSGTQWLTKALNRHPDILTVHAFDFSPKKKVYYRTTKAFLDSVERQGKIIAENPDIDSMFSRIDNGQYKVVGNVHGMSVLDSNGELRPSTRPYFASYILRHPVARSRSVASRWSYEQTLDPTRHTGLMERARRGNEVLVTLIEPAALAELPDEQALLLAAIDYVIAMDAPYMRSRVLNVEFERLIGDRDYLKWYVDQLVGSAITVTSDFIDQMYEVGPVDRRNEGRRYAVEEYAAWPAWMKTSFERRLDQLGIGDLYALRGYGL